MAKLIKFVKRKLGLEVEGTQASYPALPLTQNGQKFYLLTIPVGDIFPLSFVSKRSEDAINGFQRVLSKDRAKDIAKYLDDSRGSIPTNIVLSAQESAALEYSSDSKTLKYTRARNAFLVLDGQHRLYGYGMTTKPHRIPVAIYEGLTRAEEARLFIDINTNQKGVPAALLLDIQQLAEIEEGSDSRLRTIFDRLAEDAESPLNGWLVKDHSAPGRISRVTFKRAVSPILSATTFSNLGEEKQYELLRNYFRAWNDNLRDPGFLKKAAYFESICDMFEIVTNTSINKFRNMKEKSLFQVLNVIKTIDFGSMNTQGKSKVTKSAIVPVLKECLSGQVSVDESMV